MKRIWGAAAAATVLIGVRAMPTAEQAPKPGPQEAAQEQAFKAGDRRFPEKVRVTGSSVVRMQVTTTTELTPRTTETLPASARKATGRVAVRAQAASAAIPDNAINQQVQTAVIDQIAAQPELHLKTVKFIPATEGVDFATVIVSQDETCGSAYTTTRDPANPANVLMGMDYYGLLQYITDPNEVNDATSMNAQHVQHAEGGFTMQVPIDQAAHYMADADHQACTILYNDDGKSPDQPNVTQP